MRLWCLVSLVVAVAPLSLKKVQQEKLTVNLLSAVPDRARVLEIDCVDRHEHLFHLPSGCKVTQWYATAPNRADAFQIDRVSETKSLDVEVVTPPAPGKTPKLPTDSFDVAFGVRSLERAAARGGTKAARQVVDAVMKSLAPHTGKFCFIEDTAYESLLSECLDEHPFVRDCDVVRDTGTICGWARRNRRDPNAKAPEKLIAEKGGMGGGVAPQAKKKKKKGKGR